MKTIPLYNKGGWPSGSIQLPDCWEDLSFRERIFTFGILSELFAGTVTPEIARLKMLIEYTGYKPSWIQIIREALKKNSEQREIIHFNLLKLSEELTFAFTVLLLKSLHRLQPGRYLPLSYGSRVWRRFWITCYWGMF